jgi:uncharacterized membrane protein
MIPTHAERAYAPSAPTPRRGAWPEAPLARAGCLLTLALGACGAFPRLHVETSGGSMTSENGQGVEIVISLEHAPAGALTVYAVSSDGSEGRASAPVEFDASNWRESRTIHIAGVDDTVDDGDAPFDVTVYARAAWRSEEPDRPLQTFHLTNRDDDGASFEGLGDLPGGESASYVTDVSASGEVVVGWSHGRQGEQAVRWTQRDGLQPLSGREGRAQAVSPDGELIAGSVSDPTYEGGRAGVLWRGSAPFELLVDPADPESQRSLLRMVDGKVILDDARVFGTCLEAGAYDDPLACRFDPSGAVTIYDHGHVFAANQAGTIAGTRTSIRSEALHSHATCNGSVLPYPNGADCTGPSTACMAEARDFALGGARIVGTSRVPEPGVNPEAEPALLDTAFVYSPATGALGLSNLDFGLAATGAYAINGGGRVIAGYGTDDRGQEALVWVDGTPERVEDVLLRAGGSVPEGWQLFEVTAMSSDTRTLVGNGSNPDGAPEAFRIVLPNPL